MIVLGLFNGMTTGRQALEDLGHKVTKYYSSELKPSAIELTQLHFPDTIQLGDILNWRSWNIDWKSINIVLSGSPCQDLSNAGNRAGLFGLKSSLFFVFVEILEHIKSLNPNVIFFQENVGSASKKDVGIMSRALGVYPVRINSSLVSAQNRDRYYWTNIRTKETMFDVVTDIPQPRDKKIMLKDIIESGHVDREKSVCLLEGTAKSAKYKDMRSTKAQEYLLKRNERGFITAVREATVKGYVNVEVGDCVDLAYPRSRSRRGRLMRDKSNCLLRKNDFYLNEGDYLRLFTQVELERLQGFSDGYTSILSYDKASSLLGDGWNLPTIKHIFKYINA